MYKVTIRKYSAEAVCATLQPKLSESTHETIFISFTIRSVCSSFNSLTSHKGVFPFIFCSFNIMKKKTYLCTEQKYELPDVKLYVDRNEKEKENVIAYVNEW